MLAERQERQERLPEIPEGEIILLGGFGCVLSIMEESDMLVESVDTGETELPLEYASSPTLF